MQALLNCSITSYVAIAIVDIFIILDTMALKFDVAIIAIYYDMAHNA